MNELKNYRQLISTYDTFLMNIEAEIKAKVNVQNRIDRHCLEAYDKKIYNIAHRAKHELSALKFNKQFDFVKIKNDIKNDTSELLDKIEALTANNPFLLQQDLFIRTIHWFKGFCEFTKDIRPGYIAVSTWQRTNKTEKKNEALITLNNIFLDSQSLKKLVELLIERKFVSMEAGRLTWTGIEHETARGRGYQLIALSEVCRPLYFKNKYQAKELHAAWTSYFDYPMDVNNWQPSLKQKILTRTSYFNLFTFVRHSLKF